MAEKPHVRIGDYWFLLAEGLDETGLLGLHPMQRRWQSIFAARQGIPGNPGIQNLREDDLRWEQTSWRNGEGQRVIDATDDESFRRFERSQAIDLVNPGQLQLAKAMAQQGFTGIGPTTINGSSFTDDVGTSTVVNATERRLNAALDAIKADTSSLAAGSWQIDVYGELEDPTKILGKDLIEFKPSVTPVGDDCRLSPRAVATTTGHSPPEGDVIITAQMTFLAPVPTDIHSPTAQAQWRLVVYDETDGSNVTAGTYNVRMVRGGNTDVESVTFRPRSGHVYRYRVKLVFEDTGVTTFCNYVTIDPQEHKEITWQVKQGSTVLNSGTQTLRSRTSAKLASATIISPGATVYTVRVSWTDGSSSKPIVTKAVYEKVGMHDPRCVELGYADKTWLIDYSASAVPSAFYWNPQTAQWVAVATFGVSASKARAMAHSDNYEFVGMDDSKVYRIQTGSVAVYSAATTDALVGIAVGGNRLFALTETTANGTSLFDTTLEGTPSVAWTSRYVPGNVGVNPDTDLPQRIAGTENGAVFFANQGPDCFVYRWDGSTGVPYAKLPTGFRGRAITYGSGFVWLGGSFPAPDSDGTTRHRPALFLIDSSGVPTELATQLWRDDDPSTHIRMIQLYGPDLWVLAETSASPKTMRLWRVALTTFSAFLEQEITTDESQASTTSRGLAVNFLDRIAIWGKGNPYLQGRNYQTHGEASLESSRYTFALTEVKELIAIDVDGVFPTVPAFTGVQNSAEGGVPPGNVTVANSGGASGTPWDAVSGSPHYSLGGAIHGAVAIGHNAIDGYQTCSWTAAGAMGAAVRTVFGRMYFKRAKQSGDNDQRIVNVQQASGNSPARIHFDSGHHLVAEIGTSSVSGTTVIPEAPFRLEWKVFSHASSGYLTVRIYLSPESTTPDEEITTALGNVAGGNQFDSFDVGYLAGAATVGGMNWDAIALSPTDWIGPDPGGGATAVDVDYAIDGGDFVKGGTWTTAQRQLVSSPGGHVFFHTIQLKTSLRTTEQDVTPTVYSVAVQAYLQTYDKGFDLILQCFDDGSVYHQAGQQVDGSVGIDYLFSLVQAGGVVEFEDRYSSHHAEDADTSVVSIKDPQAVFVRPGEAYVKLRLTERGT